MILILIHIHPLLVDFDLYLWALPTPSSVSDDVVGVIRCLNVSVPDVHVHTPLILLPQSHLPKSRCVRPGWSSECCWHCCWETAVPDLYEWSTQEQHCGPGHPSPAVRTACWLNAGHRPGLCPPPEYEGHSWASSKDCYACIHTYMLLFAVTVVKQVVIITICMHVLYVRAIFIIQTFGLLGGAPCTWNL